jgi:hypothetical protein
MVSTALEQARDIPRYAVKVVGVPHNTIVRNLNPRVISDSIAIEGGMTEGGITLSLDCTRHEKIGVMFLVARHNTISSIIKG